MKNIVKTSFKSLPNIQTLISLAKWYKLTCPTPFIASYYVCIFRGYSVTCQSQRPLTMLLISSGQLWNVPESWPEGRVQRAWKTIWFCHNTGTKTIVKCAKNQITIGFVIFTCHTFSSYIFWANLHQPSLLMMLSVAGFQINRNRLPAPDFCVSRK